MLLILVGVWLGSSMLVLVGLWFFTRPVSRRTLEAPSIVEDGQSDDLRELMQAYRRRSKSVPLEPVAAAYADAADDLEEITSHKPSTRVSPERAGIKVSECMTRNVQVAQIDEPIRKAAQFMLKADAGSIPVCEGDRVIGMVTDRDLAVRALAEGRGPETPLRDIMTNELVCCFEDDDIENALRKMSENKVRRLPIISRDEERLVGIVSLGDLTHSNFILAGRALEEVTQPSPLHDQSRER